MSNLTPGQCAQLSFLAATHQTVMNHVQWRKYSHDDRYELQWRVVHKHGVTGWSTLFWTRNYMRFDQRLKVADVYYKAAGSIQDVLKVVPSVY